MKFLLQAVCHVLVAVFIIVSDTVATPQWAIGSILAIFCFTASFAATWGVLKASFFNLTCSNTIYLLYAGPVVWVVQSEILPLRARARGTALATLTNWTANTIIGKVAPLVLAAIGAYSYVVLACCCAAMAIYAAVAVPETMGISLEHMDQLFEQHGNGSSKAVSNGVDSHSPSLASSVSTLKVDTVELTETGRSNGSEAATTGR